MQRLWGTCWNIFQRCACLLPTQPGQHPPQHVLRSCLFHLSALSSEWDQRLNCALAALPCTRTESAWRIFFFRKVWGWSLAGWAQQTLWWSWSHVLQRRRQTAAGRNACEFNAHASATGHTRDGWSPASTTALTHIPHSLCWRGLNLIWWGPSGPRSSEGLSPAQWKQIQYKSGFVRCVERDTNPTSSAPTYILCLKNRHESHKNGWLVKLLKYRSHISSFIYAISTKEIFSHQLYYNYCFYYFMHACSVTPSLVLQMEDYVPPGMWWWHAECCARFWPPEGG